MAATYELIASTTLATTTTTVTFSSIPADYTDLVLRVSARLASGSFGNLGIRPNGSAANDSTTRLYVENTTIYSDRYTNDYNIISLSGASSTANTFGSIEVYIPNYAASTYKQFSSFGAAENNSSTVYKLGVNANLWQDTTPISSLDINGDGYDFLADSSFFLYGIKNS